MTTSISENEKSETVHQSSTITASAEQHASIVMENKNPLLLNNNKKNKTFTYSLEEKRLVKKINWATVPFIIIIIFFQYIDKITLNYSTVMNLFEDTNMNGDEFNWAGSLYYGGYLIFLFPNQYFMHRFALSKYLGLMIVFWGVTLACTAFARNFQQLAVLRFMLGFWESAAMPCVGMIISITYRRREQAILFGLLLSTYAFGGAIGGLMGYGFLQLNGVYGLSSWRWYMITLGCITVIMGLITFLFMPDNAKSRWYRLTTKEEEIVEERIQDSAVVQQAKINFGHILESVKEIRFYCFFLLIFLTNLLNGAVSIYSTLIIKNLGGFSEAEAILLSIPYNIISIILISMATYFSSRFREYGYTAATCCIITLIGLILLIALPKGHSIVVGIFLAIIGPQYSILTTLISVNTSGYTKKSFYSSMGAVSRCLGNFVGPLLMHKNQFPRYTDAMVTFAITTFISALLFLYIRWSYVQDNRHRRNQLLSKDNENIKEDINITDKENVLFIYHP